MKLTRNFYLRDIRKYEDTTGNNIISYFSTIKINNLLDLIMLGNNNCSKEEASRILDNYLFFNENSILTAFLEIREQLLGIGSNEDIEDDDENNEDMIDISSYETLSALYNHFCMQLMSVGLRYSEFWDMTTSEMYSVFNSIVVKMQNETNRELSNYHTLAALIGASVWGKLPKEPPRVKLQKDEDDDLKILSNNLSAFANSYNNRLEKEEGIE